MFYLLGQPGSLADIASWRRSSEVQACCQPAAAHPQLGGLALSGIRLPTDLGPLIHLESSGLRG